MLVAHTNLNVVWSDYGQLHICYETKEGIIREYMGAGMTEFEPDHYGGIKIVYKNYEEARQYFKSRGMDIIHDDGLP